MKSILTCALIVAVLLVPSVLPAADKELDRAQLELVVDEARELMAEAERPGSATHYAAYRYYFGLVYGCGTNVLARTDSQKTTQLARRYMKLVEHDYEAYTKIEDAFAKAQATGNDHVQAGRRIIANGSRKRAARIADAEKLGDKELAKAIKDWESFVKQLKKK